MCNDAGSGHLQYSTLSYHAQLWKIGFKVILHQNSTSKAKCLYKDTKEILNARCVPAVFS